jgi:uncharacterized protein YjbJ (UPF0337 family)
MAGLVDKIKGALKLKTGKITGNLKLEIEGKDELATGYAEQAVADAQAGVRDYEARQRKRAAQEEKAREKFNLSPQV